MQSPRVFFLYALLLCMELTAGFVLLIGSSLLDATSLGYAAYWVALLVGIAGTATTLGILTRPLGARWDQVALVTAGLIAAGVAAIVTASDGVSRMVDAVLFAVAFWRGISVTREPPSHTEVERRFGFGFAFFFVGIIGLVARGLMNDRWVWQLIAIIGIGYIVVSLIALTVARIEQQREPGALQAVLLAVSAQIALLVLLGIVALQIFSLDMFGWLGNLTQPFFDVVGATMYKLLAPLGFVLDSLFSLIRHHARHTVARVAPYLPPGNTHLKKPTHHPKQHINGTAYEIAGLISMLIVLAGIGYLIWRSIPRRFRGDRTARKYAEHRESAISLPELWLLILNAIRSLYRRSTDAAALSIVALRRRVWGAPYPSDPVRKTYAQLMRRTTQAGLPRHDATTPHEYQRELKNRWAEGSLDFTELTEAYVARRYGDRSFSPDDVSRLHAHWQHVRKVVRIPKAEET